MARPPKFERDVLLDRAVGVFWSAGYEGASVEALVREMGIHPGTLYHLFGDKHGLFLEALERYERTVGDYFVRLLEEDDADLETLRRFFDTSAHMLTSVAGRQGCLLTNTAVERGPTDAEAAQRVRRYFERLERAFEGALRTSRRAGQIAPRPDAELRAAARHLSSVLHGMRVLARAGADAGALGEAAQAALAGLAVAIAPLPAWGTGEVRNCDSSDLTGWNNC